MKKVDPKKFTSYTIAVPGWKLLIHDFDDAKREWNNINKAGSTFYGNKPDGSMAIIDTK